MTSGILKKKADAYKLINNSIILGSLEGEELSNVEVITITQYLRDLAFNDAIKASTSLTTEDEIERNVLTLLQTTYTESEEFIKVDSDRILICVDETKIDDRATDRALLMLVELEDFRVGTKFSFGGPQQPFKNSTPIS